LDRRRHGSHTLGQGSLHFRDKPESRD
jgi:hypothetical protein